MFRIFSQDGGHSLSAIEFVKLCKVLKVYPVCLIKLTHPVLKVIIQFEYLKKIILKAPEYWQNGNGSSSTKSGGISAHHLGGVSEIVSTIFTFKDFFKAFKVN